MHKTQRSAATVIAVIAVMLGALVALPAPAQALTWYAPQCSGFAACDGAGRPNVDYESVYTQSFWYMYGGHNCTNYAAYRLMKRGIPDFITTGHGNATDWGSQAKAKGYAVDTQAPKPGDIAWWSSARISPVGHVAYVESVDAAAGTFVVSEDNSSSTFDWRTYRISEVSGFIHMSGKGAFTDGRFVSYQGVTYRMVGGAPVAVGSWAAFGGVQPVTAVTAAQWASLRANPADGSIIKSAQTGQVFVIAGGAPQYVSAWSAVGGKLPTVAVDQAAIDKAGGTGGWSHLRAVPADNHHLTDGTGQSYATVGGAPLGIASLSDVGAYGSTRIDSAVLDHAGSSVAPWNHLRAQPSDGAYVAAPGGRIYRVVGGAAVWLSSWSAVGGSKPSVRISAKTLSSAGAAGPWRFLRARAADGAVIKTLPSASYFLMKGGYWFRSGAASGAVTLADNSTLPSGVARVTPAIAGTPGVGQTLTVKDGAWAPAPVSLAHQWRRNGAAISGATGASYKLVAADAGQKITVTTTGTRSGLATGAATSTAVTVAAH